jgi:ribulose-bisphosphate carboxylase large chain
MAILGPKVLDIIKVDLDNREEVIRTAVYDALSQMAEPDLSQDIVVTYFVLAQNLSPAKIGKEICYHMTSGVRSPEQGTLLDQCTGKVVDSVCFDKQQDCGLVRVAFPLKMLQDNNGNIYSTDILHITGGAGILALRENVDAKLVDIAMSDKVIAMFPGPAYGAQGVRNLTNFGNDIAFGTILKPCTGITPEQEAKIIYESACNPMFMFIKEDENFLPGVDFAPVARRAKLALEAIEKAKANRKGKGLIFSSHITSPPQLAADYVRSVLDTGVNGLMFSEYYCGGMVRMVREMTRNMECPPAIYGHNGGITARTRHIYREVLDMFARLDGIDFRQTAPLVEGLGLLRPFGLEWRKCEEMLTRPMAGKPAVMIARAGGLDQGNIIQNLLDVKYENRQNYLFLSGSAINSIKDSHGNYDPTIGAEAMRQALKIFEKNVFTEISDITVPKLRSYADSNDFDALSIALAQRYH